MTDRRCANPLRVPECVDVLTGTNKDCNGGLSFIGSLEQTAPNVDLRANRVIQEGSECLVFSSMASEIGIFL